MRSRLRAGLAGLAVVLATAALHAAATAQGVNNYFARTPETDALLNSNEKNHLGKGVDDLRNGRVVYARNEFDFILNIWPNHPQVLSLMAETLIRLGRADQIDEYFSRAYELSPDVAQLRITHGVALLRADKVNDAIKQLQRGAELDDGSVNAHYNLGLALVRAKRYEEANRHAQRAYALGHPLPGLRDQLKKARAWKPDAAAGAAEAPKKAQ